MTDTPERIFRWVPPNSGGHIEYSDFPIRSPFAREYILADLVHADAELAKQHHAQAFGAGVDSAAPKVKPLVWGEMEWGQDQYGFQEWGEFTSDLISLSTCHRYAIYQNSDSEYMWTDGDHDNMRYSTYRQWNDPDWVPKIPWHPTPEAAKAAAGSAHERRTLSELEG